MKFAVSLRRIDLWEVAGRTKKRRGIIKSRQADIPGRGVTGWRWWRRLRKVLVTRERKPNNERKGRKGGREREREKHQ